MAASEGSAAPIADICREIRRRQRFLLTSHARPDGDSIGSQLALALGLRALGKDVRIVNRDPAPGPLQALPGVAEIEIVDHVEGEYDAVVVLECSDFARTGVDGLGRYFTINIDHHPGNTEYGQVNWIDQRIAACGQMVYEIIEALEVPLSPAMATDVYLTILSDTGGFHHSGMTARTFDVCRRTLDAGADPHAVATIVFDSTSLGRLKLLARMLDAMELDPTGRLATLYLDDEILAAAAATSDDTEGLINVPLSVRSIQAVLLLRQVASDEVRVSFRSKGRIDVRAVASEFGGGGHVNAAGCTIAGAMAEVRNLLRTRVLHAIDRTTGS